MKITATLAIFAIFATVALAPEPAHAEGLGLFSTRKLKDDAKDIVDCVPMEKDCPYGEYCVYYPDKKCKKVKECKPEKVKKCVKYSVYYETPDPYKGYDKDANKETKCVEYGYETKEKCYYKDVCYEYICAKLADGYY